MLLVLVSAPHDGLSHQCLPSGLDCQMSLVRLALRVESFNACNYALHNERAHYSRTGWNETHHSMRGLNTEKTRSHIDDDEVPPLFRIRNQTQGTSATILKPVCCHSDTPQRCNTPPCLISSPKQPLFLHDLTHPFWPESRFGRAIRNAPNRASRGKIL